MGTEAAWIPAVLALAGAGVQQHNTVKTANKRDAELARGIQDASRKQEQANQAVNQNIDSLEGSRSEPFKESLQDRFVNTIQRQRAQGVAGLNTGGDTSDAYKDSAGRAKTGAIDYAGQISSLLSGIDAAGLQRQSEGFARNEVGMDLRRLGMDAEQDSFLAKLRASGVRENPWLNIASAGLSGAAAGYGGGATGGAGTSAPQGIMDPKSFTFVRPGG